ncbi:MAG: rane protein insertase [Candidatus Midichloriaceae bacterium]|jgi:YidC/Oxa1 family membrane protein insertase|nr:rane protein insertase [Candidatus Midichloriaceae bacterium]
MIDRMSQNVRLIIASILAAVVIFAWQTFYVDPMLEAAREEQRKIEASIEKSPPITASLKEAEIFDREVLLSDTENARVKFNNGNIKGSINLVGARLDDLVLSKYRITPDYDSKNVVLLSPSKAAEAYFAEFGWLSKSDENIDMPTNKTKWNANKKEFKAGESLVLSHINAQGIEFIIEILMDEDYLFTFKQKVINHSSDAIHLANYGLINRATIGSAEDNMIIHEGGIGVFDGKLKEVSYSDISSSAKLDYNKFSWIGFSDKYWLTSIIPTKNTGLVSRLSSSNKGHTQRFQASFNNESVAQISPGQKMEWPDMLLFAGAKELDVLDKYEAKYNIPLFDRAVDFGILYFVTKPIFELLHYFYTLVGNFGVAILILTVVIKLLLFPLAHKGFKGMNRLKELQPKMAALKEKYGNDATAFQRALLDMYKKEKVNPMGGCLPILLQIPIFFALYKVLYVTIEMRQAPFFGWIKDLSVPDPYTITNLFGLIPWDPPSFLMIGIFPILMALTMFFQQRLNPEPSDPVQAQVMKLLPIVFLFMFASFPSGLVIYWTWSNVLSILQQVLIKRLEKK